MRKHTQTNAKTASKRTMTHMPIAYAALLVILVGVSGRPWAAYALRRSRKQPIAETPQDEQLVLAHLMAHPEAYADATTLTENDFTRAEHRRAWSLLQSSAGPCPHPEQEPRTDPCGCVMTEQQHDKARTSIERELGNAYLSELPKDTTGEQFLAAGEKILAASNDRALSGAAHIGTSADGKSTWILPQLGIARVSATTALLGLSLLGGWILALASYADGPSRMLAVIALTALAYGTVLWTLVDFDTLYIDTPTLIGLGGLAWAGSIGAALLAGEPHRLLGGLIASVAVAVLFEGTNLLYRLLRGRHGIGGGDTRLALVTIGVPASIVGTWNYGYGSLLAGLLLAVCAYPILRRTGHTGRTTPFAFGPYLATGWAALALTLPISIILGRPW